MNNPEIPSSKPNNAEVCSECGRSVEQLSGLCPVCLLAQGTDSGESGVSTRPRPAPPSLETVAGLFPKLRLVRLLGVGGMGIVFEARQPDLDRRVALKLLPVEPSMGSGPDFGGRFNREAKALARLNHPNIVSVHEFGQVEEWMYFIMEFVDGVNLRQLARSGRLAPREILQLIPQICDALQYAHDEGVVHRDIKPENVLVDRKGRVKIADFGLAMILDESRETSRLTGEGQIMGTPHYMAPEQVSQPLAVDHRADIYSLGVVIYELLTGELPLGKFLPPSQKVQVDVRLDNVVLRALENDRSRRYQQASEFKSEANTAAGPNPSTTPNFKPSKATSPEEPHSTELNSIRLLWIVSTAFLIYGLATLGTTSTHFSVLGLFGIPLGLGLMRRRPWWRLTAIAYLWAIALYQALFVISPTIASSQTALKHWLPIFLSEPRSIAGTSPLLALLGGMIFILTNPSIRALFENRKLDRPWLEWGALTGGILAALSLSISAPSIVRNEPRIPPYPNQVAATLGADGRMSANLPRGGRIELVALANFSDSNLWWNAAGQILEHRYQVPGLEPPSIPSHQHNLALFRTVGLPPPVKMVAQPDASISGPFPTSRDQRRIRDTAALLISWYAYHSAGDLRLGFPGEWKTSITHYMDGSASEVEVRPGEPEWKTSLNSVEPRGDDLVLRLGIGAIPADWEMRTLVRDRRGHDHEPHWSHSIEGRTECLVANVGFGDWESVRIEVRPVQWVEFKGVPRHPSSGDSEVRRGFGPTGRVRFGESVDLDSGKRIEFAGAGAPFDLRVGTDRIKLYSLRTVELPPEFWDFLTPSQLNPLLQSQGSGRLYLPAAGRGRKVFGFRTTEGSIGLLEYTDTPDSDETVLRYKLLENPNGR